MSWAVPVAVWVELARLEETEADQAMAAVEQRWPQYLRYFNA